MADPDNKLEKAETSGKTVARPLQLRNEKGQPHIVTLDQFVQDECKKDLEMPRRLCTFDKMMEDDAVSSAVNLTLAIALKALKEGKYVGKKGSTISQQYADQLNYNIHNMSRGTWLEFCNNALTSMIYGFQINNIVMELRTTGEYSNTYCIKSLSPRDQKSIYGWVWDKHRRDLLGVVQQPPLVSDRNPTMKDYEYGIPVNQLVSSTYYREKYPVLATEQIIHFRFDPTNNNPQGHSPLTDCYTAWKEKILVERYEITGTSKDLGGVGILRLPLDMIEKAGDPENYPDIAKEYIQIQKDALALLEGKSGLMVMASDTDPSSKAADYDLQIESSDSSGKSYSTSDIIEQKRKAIYNVFGAGVILLGQEGVGSYALSSDKKSLHGFFVERLLDWIKDVLDNQLAKTVLKVNDISLDYKDMPYFEFEDPAETSMDEVGKFIQRTASLGVLTREAAKVLFEALGLPTDELDDVDFEAMSNVSNAGEGNGTSGTGNTQEGGSASDNNSENAE